VSWAWPDRICSTAAFPAAVVPGWAIRVYLGATGERLTDWAEIVGFSNSAVPGDVAMVKHDAVLDGGLLVGYGLAWEAIAPLPVELVGLAYYEVP
jgi:hypothetical protein